MEEPCSSATTLLYNSPCDFARAFFDISVVTSDFASAGIQLDPSIGSETVKTVPVGGDRADAEAAETIAVGRLSVGVPAGFTAPQEEHGAVVGPYRVVGDGRRDPLRPFPVPETVVKKMVIFSKVYLAFFSKYYNRRQSLIFLS